MDVVGENELLVGRARHIHLMHNQFANAVNKHDK